LKTSRSRIDDGVGVQSRDIRLNTLYEPVREDILSNRDEYCAAVQQCNY